MASDAEVWWSVMRNYAPLKPYFEYLGITSGGHTSVLRRMMDGQWRTLLIGAGDESPLERAIGAKTTGENPLNPADALAFFQENYPLPSLIDPSVNMGLSVIPTAFAEPLTQNPINSNFTDQEFIKLIDMLETNFGNSIRAGNHTVLDEAKKMAVNLYSNLKKYWNPKQATVILDLIAEQRLPQLPTITIPEAVAISEPEIQPITEPIITEKTWSGWVTKPSGKVERITLTISTMQRLINEGWIFTEEEPQPDKTSCYMVYDQKLELNQQAVDYYKNIGVSVTPCEPEPEPTWSGWVTKPSGEVERITLTISTMQRLINEGWVFTEEEPQPEPENHNVSVIFYTEIGGDLKTHFGINTIVVTPDEAKNLADWLSQNYNTKILLVTNRLTNDVRTHTVQQIKELIIQKLQDDEPDKVIKKPQEIGFMGAGMAGAIAGLVLLGFVIDHKRGN